MKLKAGEVYVAVEAIRKLQGERLPVKGKYWLARIMTKLEPEWKTLEEQRNDLIKKHGEESEGKIEVKAGKISDFVFDWSAVLQEEVEVDCPKVKLEHLGDDNIETDLTPIMPFIEE